MKETIYTIPVNEGFEAKDECPFCAMERAAERSAIRYVAGLGASYMEPDVRAATDRAGFCRQHMKKLYDYGNPLGSALMLQTYMAGLIEEFACEAEKPDVPAKKGLFTRKQNVPEQTYGKQLRNRADSCYLCDKIQNNMARYFETFFYLIREPEFRVKVEQGKGFCLDHFAALLEVAESKLPDSQRKWFYDTVYAVMLENLIRVKGDLDWLVARYDYRNAGKPWGNSQDALQRTMQKLTGGYPADAPYKNE